MKKGRRGKISHVRRSYELLDDGAYLRLFLKIDGKKFSGWNGLSSSAVSFCIEFLIPVSAMFVNKISLFRIDFKYNFVNRFSFFLKFKR